MSNELNFDVEFSHDLGFDLGFDYIGNHPDLMGRSLPDQHPISSITDLEYELSLREKLTEIRGYKPNTHQVLKNSQSGELYWEDLPDEDEYELIWFRKG